MHCRTLQLMSTYHYLGIFRPYRSRDPLSVSLGWMIWLFALLPTVRKLLFRRLAVYGCFAGQFLDICAFHCMQPNLARGKTELMLTFRGNRLRQFRVRYYGPTAATHFPIVRENGASHIQLVSHYKRLGCLLHHTGDQAVEVRIKAAVGHAAFNEHRKILFGNPHIELSKRAALFHMLVMSKCLYGAES